MMRELIQQIEQWAEERNLIEGSTPQKQLFKLVEEIGELFNGHNKNKNEIIKDSIGDCFVVCIILCKQLHYSCLEDDIQEAFECYSLPRKLYIKNREKNLCFILNSLGVLSQEISGEDEFPEYDAIGTIVYNLIHYSYGLSLDFKECVQHAYNQIKDRKGRMIDGVFVKEEDL